MPLHLSFRNHTKSGQTKSTRATFEHTSTTSRIRGQVCESTPVSPLNEPVSPHVENHSKHISLASARARITAGSNVLIFLITLDDNLSEKPWFVGVIRTGSMRSIASDYFLVAKSWSESKTMIWEKFTIGIPIVNAPQYHKIMILGHKRLPSNDRSSY